MILLDNKSDDKMDELRIQLLSDFLFFVRFFFEVKNKREFIISKPVSAESHFLTIARELTEVFKGNTKRIAINCPPGWSKSVLAKYFVAWATARYPDCNHMYISFSHELASSHTYDIKQLVSLPIYRNLFDVHIKRDSSAKDFFCTDKGGEICAFGSAGSITGRNAGLPGMDRYSGGLIIDDIHKPDEVHSDLKRDKVKRNYYETIETRLRGKDVPIIMIGQRLHEDDIFAHLDANDSQEWKKVIIKATDECGNAMYPEVLPNELIKIKEKTQRYVWSSQYLQCPIPSGGALYQREDFLLLDEEPDVIATFITADTAETDKEWNDASVFSFWGVYKPRINNVITEDLYAIHWLDCYEIYVEPRDLESEFIDFWSSCMRYKVKPKVAFIEKKSTGTTLVSVLKNHQGIKVREIERTVASGSKSQRFIDLQQYIALKLVTLPSNSRHTQKCIDHMIKITPNNTHRHDDIADTCYDAVRAAIIDRVILTNALDTDYNNIARMMHSRVQEIDTLRRRAHGSSSTLSRPFS